MSVSVLVTLIICVLLLVALRICIDLALIRALGDEALEPLPPPVGYARLGLGGLYKAGQRAAARWRGAVWRVFMMVSSVREMRLPRRRVVSILAGITAAFCLLYMIAFLPLTLDAREEVHYPLMILFVVCSVSALFVFGRLYTTSEGRWKYDEDTRWRGPLWVVLLVALAGLAFAVWVLLR